VEAYWDRMGLQAPIYFSGEMTSKANEIYKRFINYTNSNLKEQIFVKNAFEFKHIRAYGRGAEFGEPCVIFSSPAMLHYGASLRLFKNLCEDPRNLVILPGYCVRGTVGDKVLNGMKEIDIFGERKKINIQVENLAFSAHADTMGIMKIIRQCQPRQIMLVHGEKSRMDTLKRFIRKKLNVPVHMPANGVLLTIATAETAQVKIRTEMLRQHANLYESSQEVSLVLRLAKEKDRVRVVNAKDFLVDGSNKK